jgi:hypothetical protein
VELVRAYAGGKETQSGLHAGGNVCQNGTGIVQWSGICQS